jgi:chaperone modulatory protein CbpM
MPHTIILTEVEVLDNSHSIHISRFTEMCRVNRRTVREMVDIGLIEPVHRRSTTGSTIGRHHGSSREWEFDVTALERARRAIRLQRDLELNLAGAAMVVELMEEIEALRREVRALRATRE